MMEQQGLSTAPSSKDRVVLTGGRIYERVTDIYVRQFVIASALNAQILAISPQDVESHERFTSEHGFQFPLLADVDKSVAAAYGTLGPLGFLRRSVFVVDGTGIIRYAHRAIAGLTFRPVGELVDVLFGLPR